LLKIADAVYSLPLKYANYSFLSSIDIFIGQYPKLDCMNKHSLVLVVVAIMLLLVMNSGCINNKSVNQQIVTPTPKAAAVKLFEDGFNAFINGKYDIALEDYNKAIAAEPKYTRAWIEKGNVLVKLNRTGEAISAYDSALALENNIALVWNTRGEALMSLGRYAEARDSFDKALQLAPDYAKAKENKNLTLEKLK
jgi:tetratricopeptide (TPR) repeat protein